MARPFYESHDTHYVRTRWATLRSILFFREDHNLSLDVDVHRLGRRVYRVVDDELAKEAMEMLATGDTLILYIRVRNMMADVISYELVLPNPGKEAADRWLDITYSSATSARSAGLMDMPLVDQWVSRGDIFH
jgi:hypothetical protein